MAHTGLQTHRPDRTAQYSERTPWALLGYQPPVPFQHSSYRGERHYWAIVAGQHRESDTIARANFAVIRDDLKARYPESMAVESFTSNLVGWVDYVIIDLADADARRAALAWRDRIDDSIIADEEQYNALEWEEAPRCPDCGARHFTRSGEYDTARYHERCPMCKARWHMIGHLANHPHRTSRYGSALTRHSFARRRRLALARGRRTA